MSAAGNKFARLAALKPARPMPVRPDLIRQPGEEDALSRLLGAGIATNHFGEHLTVRNWFSTPEFADPSSTTLELLSHTRDKSLSRKTRAALQDPERWLFLDTETTGLAGGTGTYAFLIGLAWWDAGGLQVEQFFMRDFVEEHSLLQELSQRVTERPVLVTFNGKSFDWPLLENRFAMTRSIAVPKLAAHLDLLHPARALWRLRLGSVRLVELERQVLDASRLGWHRENDVSSALIPQFYFDYLRGGQWSRLRESFDTIKWICAGSPLSSARSTNFLLRRKAPRTKSKALISSGYQDSFSAGERKIARTPPVHKP